MVVLFLFLFLHGIHIFHECNGYSMTTTFCDGDRLVELTHDQCPFGINFGDSKPSCICIKGAYRMWMDNCAVYDGFMEDGCSTLYQNEYQVSGLRLSGSIGSLTNETAAIFGLKETDYQIWDTYLVGSKVETLTNKFYVVNGEAFFTDNKICIQPKKTIGKDKQVCRIFRADNPVWKTGYINIEVQPTCGENGVSLKVQNCYDVIQQKDLSECSLPCKNDHAEGINHLGPGIEDTAIIEPEQALIDLKECKKETVGEVRGERNKFLNRYLNSWARTRQVKDVDRPDVSHLIPRYTFELYDIMKQITQKKCPSQFVSQLFLEQALDLFIMVHQQQQHYPTEDVKEEDYYDIKEILDSCNKRSNNNPLPMYGMDQSTGCGSYDKLVGACVPHPPGSSFCINETVDVGSEFYEYKYHFVIEAAWKIVDMVQNICFDDFEESYLMFHKWEQAMETLFTREIRKLWFYPNLDTKVYQLLLTATAETDLHNLEMCVQAAYVIDPRLKRLGRPRPPSGFFTSKRRKRRSLIRTVARNHDVYCQMSERDFVYPC